MSERVAGRIDKRALADLFARADRLLERSGEEAPQLGGVGPGGRLGRTLLDELLARATVVSRAPGAARASARSEGRLREPRPEAGRRRPAGSERGPAGSTGRAACPPANRSGAPARSPDAPGRPAGATGRPAEARARPARSPGRPASATGRTPAPGRPAAPGRRAEPPGRPLGAPGRASRPPRDEAPRARPAPERAGSPPPAEPPLAESGELLSPWASDGSPRPPIEAAPKEPVATLEQVSDFLRESSEDALSRTVVEELEMPAPAHDLGAGGLEEILAQASEIRFEGYEADLERLLVETYERYRAAPSALQRATAAPRGSSAPPARFVAPAPIVPPDPIAPPTASTPSAPASPAVDPFSLDPFTGLPLGAAAGAAPAPQQAVTPDPFQADPFATDPFTGLPLTDAERRARQAAAGRPSEDAFVDPYSQAAVDGSSAAPGGGLAYEYQPFGESGGLGGGYADETAWGASWSSGLAMDQARRAPPPTPPAEPAWDAEPAPPPPAPSGPSPQVILRAFQSALLAHGLRAMLERRAPGPDEHASAPLQLLYETTRGVFQAPLRPRLGPGDRFQLADGRLYRVKTCELVFVQGVACYQELQAMALGRLDAPLRDSWDGQL